MGYTAPLCVKKKVISLSVVVFGLKIEQSKDELKCVRCNKTKSRAFSGSCAKF